MSLGMFFSIPALIMFFLGVFLAAWVKSAFGGLRSKAG
jgi:hypothetical protein